MDVLKLNENIKLVGKICELKQPGSGNSRIVMLTKINICVCCGSIVGLIKLNNCSHKQFLECYFKDRMNLAAGVVCHYCHAMLKRIDDFKKRIERCLTRKSPLLNPKPLRTLSKPIVISIQPTNITENKDMTVMQKQLVSPEAVGSEGIKEIKKEIVEGTAEPNMGVVIKQEVEDDMTDFDVGLAGAVVPPIFATAENRPDEHLIVEVPKMIEVPVEVKPENALVPNPPPTTDPSKIRKNTSSRPANELHGKVKMVMLTKEELEKEREESRRSDKYRLSEFKCDDCILGFVHQYNLDAHIMKKHDTSNGGFVCDVCKCVCKYETALQTHQLCHWKRYQCVPCGKRFKGNPMVCVSHYNKVHGADGHIINKVFECSKKDCDFTTNDFLAYKKHNNTHKKKVPCDECGKTFTCKTSMKNHKLTIHAAHIRIYKCKDCHKEFKSHGGLKFHMKRGHVPRDKPQPVHFCKICGRHYKTRQILAVHLRTHSKHLGDAKKFICDYCGEKFVFKNSIKDHIEMKHLKPEYKCNYCDRVWHNETSLKSHIRMKHTNRPPREKIPCNLCGKRFGCPKTLRCHMTTHTGERPFVCPYCSATFGFASSLYKHKQLKHNHPKVKQ